MNEQTISQQADSSQHLTALPAEALESLTNSGDIQSSIETLLQQTVTAHNAEFVLFVKKEENEYRVLCSSTIDGNIVQQANEKVPEALLNAAEQLPCSSIASDREDLPEAVRHNFEALDRKGAMLYKLRCTSPLFLYFENRFCPLESDRDTQKDAYFALTILSMFMHILDVNEALEQKSCELSKAESMLTELRDPSTFAKPTETETQKHPPPEKVRTTFKGDYNDIITCSPKMYVIFSVLDKISHTNAPVLIIGESGTGKELIATAIHKNSPRKKQSFVSENCAALTETLLESELFGYVKGAFTGAASDRKGLFEVADTGSLFLDEVGDMSPNMQKKLLRVLQENVIRKVGGKEYIPVDVRIISATNRDLSVDIQKMQFREDLFFRLNVITIELPPLRDRPEDITLLVHHFLGRLAEKNKKQKSISRETMDLLQAYPWPGNIRELQNEVQRMYTLSGATIDMNDLSSKIHSENRKSPSFSFHDFERLPLKEATESFEREFLRRALKKYYGNKSKVAKELKVPKTSLYHKIKKYDLEV